jgi:hypothetical protein
VADVVVIGRSRGRCLVADVVVIESCRKKGDYCTDITILKPTNYGPRTVLEDPHYNHQIHSRMAFNAKCYYLRRLSPAEMLVQEWPGMLYEIMQDIQLSCVYHGRTEFVTCPAGCVFNRIQVLFRLFLFLCV